MSVQLEHLIDSHASCHTCFGDVYEGALKGVDGEFNTVLLADAPKGDAAEGSVEKMLQQCRRTFIRGDHVMFIGFTKSK